MFMHVGYPIHLGHTNGIKEAEINSLQDIIRRCGKALLFFFAGGRLPYPWLEHRTSWTRQGGCVVLKGIIAESTDVLYNVHIYHA